MTLKRNVEQFYAFADFFVSLDYAKNVNSFKQKAYFGFINKLCLLGKAININDESSF